MMSGRNDGGSDKVGLAHKMQSMLGCFLVMSTVTLNWQITGGLSIGACCSLTLVLMMVLWNGIPQSMIAEFILFAIGSDDRVSMNFD